MKVGWAEIINIIILFQLLVFTIFLFVNGKKNVSNFILGIHFFSQVMGIFNSLWYLNPDFFYANFPHLALIGFPFIFLWGPTFYFYTLSVVKKNFTFTKNNLLHLIPFLIVFFFIAITFYFRTAESKTMFLKDYLHHSYVTLAIDICIRAQVLVYILLAFRLKRSALVDLKKVNFGTGIESSTKINYSWLNFIVLGYTACYIISSVFVYFEYYFSNFNKLLHVGNFLPFLIYFNFIFFKVWNKPDVLTTAEKRIKYKYSKVTKEEAREWLSKLNSSMAENKYYLKPELSLNELAGYIDIHPRILSQIINEYFDQNFYDYINQLRIEQAKKLLLNYDNKKNVLEILFETGFNSKVTFNRAFKKVTGLTPTEYRQKFI